MRVQDQASAAEAAADCQRQKAEDARVAAERRCADATAQAAAHFSSLERAVSANVVLTEQLVRIRPWGPAGALPWQ